MRFWFFLYQCLTWTLLLVAWLLLPILTWVKPKFAKWFRMRFWVEPIDFAPILQVHAVSLGEIKIAMELLPEAARKDVLFTTATQSGYSFLNEKLGHRQVRYLPWDVPFAYKRLYGNYKVPNLIVVETEIWPCLFRMVPEKGAALCIVNGRLSSKTLRLNKNPLFRACLGKATHIAVRSQLDFDRYQSFGVSEKALSVTGNIKFDFKPKVLTEPTLNQWFTNPEPLVIFASISTDEVALLVPQLKQLRQENPKLRILWAPRHLKDLDKHLDMLAEFEPQRRSQMGNQQASCLVLDTFGELSGCYQHGAISLIGGSFNSRGGQNFLESLQAGTPALMGPSTENFKREVEEAGQAGAILTLESAEEVAPAIIELLNHQDQLSKMSHAATDFLARHHGAIARTRKLLLDLGIFNQECLEDTELPREGA